TAARQKNFFVLQLRATVPTEKNFRRASRRDTKNLFSSVGCAQQSQQKKFFVVLNRKSKKFIYRDRHSKKFFVSRNIHSKIFFFLCFLFIFFFFFFFFFVFVLMKKFFFFWF